MKNDAFEQHGSVKLGSASSGGWDYSHAKRASVDRRILVVAFLLLMTCLLFWVFKSQSQPGDSTLPFAHRYTAQGHLLAIDLDHGAGSERAAVQRTWAGQETLDQHFGLGWCDLNHVRVLQVSKERVAVLRGGVGWQMGQLKGDTFVCRSGDKIRKTVSGWTLTASSGQILQFDAQGRLGSSTDASGTRWVYGYDAQSRLVSLSGGPENMLLYHYDPVRDRVVRVEGPEGLRLEYAYDAGGRLTTVVNDRKIKITYEYDKRGELSGLKDTFGRHAALAVLATQPAPDHTTKSKAKPFLEALLFES
ncbi:MAG: RHS repeat protein, partial [Kiritimatiellaeota bacterium]|nr:RHS repeat protein [Kiritimatiellota bacterium]